MKNMTLDFARLDQIADSVNPLLTLWALLVLWRTARDTPRFPLGRTLVSWLLCIGIVFVVAHLNRWLHWWPGHKWFPSGHLAYATCIATLGAVWEWRSIWLTIPLLGLYSVLVVKLGYHDWLDIAGAWLLAPTLTIAILRLLARRKQRVAVET